MNVTQTEEFEHDGKQYDLKLFSDGWEFTVSLRVYRKSLVLWTIILQCLVLSNALGALRLWKTHWKISPQQQVVTGGNRRPCPLNHQPEVSPELSE